MHAQTGSTSEPTPIPARAPLVPPSAPPARPSAAASAPAAIRESERPVALKRQPSDNEEDVEEPAEVKRAQIQDHLLEAPAVCFELGMDIGLFISSLAQPTVV
jgi:hypothetical protein